MTHPFVNRPPTEQELERLRLLLSTYQDGTGMLHTPSGTLPGWRDFERAVALAFDGKAVENKFFVDVVFPLKEEKRFYGLDCKMRGELRKAESDGIIYVEVTNAHRRLWSALFTLGITEANYRNYSSQAGKGLLDAIEQMKKEGSSIYPEGMIDTADSSYLVLLWDRRTGFYQLYQLPLTLPQPDNLEWVCHVSTRRDDTETTRLVGADDKGVLYEWYGDSGGQFKYYPSIDQALWVSEKFQLEPLPENVELGLKAKARTYFPQQWKNATQE